MHYIMKRKINIFESDLCDKLFYWALSFVLITLPFPKYSLNSLSIAFLLVLMIFHAFFNRKSFQFPKNPLPILLLTSPFTLAVFGILYTSNIDRGIEVMVKMIPFLILPTAIMGKRISRETFLRLMELFTVSVFLASLLALSKAVYFLGLNFGDYFYYQKFSLLLEKHTTYFSLFSLISISYCLNSFYLGKSIVYRVWRVFLVIYFSCILYMLSSRIGLVCLFFILIYFFWVYSSQRIKKSIRLILSLTMSIVFILVLLFSQNFQRRFEYGTNNIENSDLSLRFKHWVGVINVIQNNNIWIGNGTGDSKQGLFEEYQKVGFDIGKEKMYNAHNQFLEFTLYYGVMGLALILGLIFYALRLSIMVADHFSASIILTISLVMLTESILERQSGIILFSICFALIIGMNNDRTISDV